MRSETRASILYASWLLLQRSFRAYALAHGGARCGSRALCEFAEFIAGRHHTSIPEKYRGETFANDKHSVRELAVLYTQRFMNL